MSAGSAGARGWGKAGWGVRRPWTRGALTARRRARARARPRRRTGGRRRRAPERHRRGTRNRSPVTRVENLDRDCVLRRIPDQCDLEAVALAGVELSGHVGGGEGGGHWKSFLGVHAQRLAPHRPGDDVAGLCLEVRLAERDLGADPRAGARRALDSEPTLQGLDPVDEAAQTRAAVSGRRRRRRRRRPRRPRTPFSCATRTLTVDRLGVLGHVRERLGDDVEGCRLDRAGQPRRRESTSSSTGSGERSASDSSAGPSPRSVRTAGWMPRASSRSSSSASASSSLAPVRIVVGRVRVEPELRLREPQRERERDEPLLGAVVEVALEPPRSASPASTMRAREAAALLAPRRWPGRWQPGP